MTPTQQPVAADLTALRAAFRPMDLEQPWTTEHSRTYPQQAAKIINAARAALGSAPATNLEACNFCLSQAAEARAELAAIKAATPVPASEQLYRRVVSYEGFGVTGVVFEPVATPVQPVPASEPVEPECCPACDGEGTMIVMSDGGPDAYEVTVDCEHCKGNQTLRAAYDGVVELLDRSEKKYHEAAAILYLGRAHPTAAKRLIELAEYAVKPNRQDEWLRDRLLALADMASVAAPTAPATPATIEAVKVTDSERLDFLCNSTSSRYAERHDGFWRVYQDIAKPEDESHNWYALTSKYYPTAREAIDSAAASYGKESAPANQDKGEGA